MKGEIIQYPEEDGDQKESLNFPFQVDGYPDNELPLDFQDTFGFLDMMDMPTSNQVQNSSFFPQFFIKARLLLFTLQVLKFIIFQSFSNNVQMSLTILSCFVAFSSITSSQ